jgi:hypothetical protein
VSGLLTVAFLLVPDIFQALRRIQTLASIRGGPFIKKTRTPGEGTLEEARLDLDGGGQIGVGRGVQRLHIMQRAGSQPDLPYA